MNLARNKIRYLGWMRHILNLVVKPRVMQGENIFAELNIDRAKPICYVLPNNSLADLLVLDQICIETGMPRPLIKPSGLKFSNDAACIYLQRLGLLQVTRASGKKPPTPMLDLVKEAKANVDIEVQLIPVSIFWGRNPGKEEKSLFKLLFFDDERAGVLQKLFIILAQGRSNFVNFGKPISLRDQVNSQVEENQIAKKIRRVLRVHFRKERSAATGPSIPSRSAIAASIMATKSVREVIDKEAKEKNLSLEKVEARAYGYLMEIVADTKYSVVRFFDICLQYLWNKIYDGVEVIQPERARELALDYEVVFTPCHRSHMDYLLISWTLYQQGVFPPNTAAGVNLNFWPVGTLLRRGGAFYLRRTFKGNRLYTAVFNEYIHYILTKGYSLKYYIEGGRSRTGKLLQPKTGMVNMTLQSYFRNSNKPIAFVPVYVGYDKVVEVNSYLKELRGRTKKNESIKQLLKAREIFKINFGKAYLGFGEPIILDDWLDEFKKDWRADVKEFGSNPPWLKQACNDLGRESLTRVNSAAIMSPVALFSLVILSSPTKAIAEEDLIFYMDALLQAIKKIPYSKDLHIGDDDARQILEKAYKVMPVKRFEHPGGDIIYVDEADSVLLTYYRNNIIHLLAVPALVVSFFQHNDRINESELIASCKSLYPFIYFEYFLRWRPETSEEVIGKAINALVDLGYLQRDGSTIERPDFESQKFSANMMLSRVLGPTLERYAVSSAMLSQNIDGGKAVDRSEFEMQCLKMAQRISILNGNKDPEFFDKGLFRQFVNLLSNLGYVSISEDDKIVVREEVGSISQYSMGLLSNDIRQSISRMTGAKFEVLHGEVEPQRLR